MIPITKPTITRATKHTSIRIILLPHTPYLDMSRHLSRMAACWPPWGSRPRNSRPCCDCPAPWVHAPSPQPVTSLPCLQSREYTALMVLCSRTRKFFPAKILTLAYAYPTNSE